MSNKLESYQFPFSFTSDCSSKIIYPRAEQQQQSVVSAAVKMENMNRERESIHSGQFMISTFEAEEAQDDLDDSEVKMLDPEDPNLSKLDETNTCMEMQLYVPQKITYQHKQTAIGNENETGAVITSHLEIETSLTKLFKCMNLAYSQKLTSPKWNHFKGVRLRWKDKIRLNNVIWRCWHMQFILKRKTPVCQFASPLDVDVHSNPQSIVLEGKYWKRQLVVIKAEYRKWRRNYKAKVIGHLSYDKSELDLLEWSPLNDRNIMISEDWTTDTLFSAINVPFPFPDPREIARGASIADFIQPSLGPLQPNLDDIDFTFAELLENSRLPPVPEEGTEEMLKVDYNFPIIENEGITTDNIMDVTSSNVTDQLAAMDDDDANMMELNTTLNSLPFNQIEQQFASTDSSNNIMETNRNTLSEEDAIMSDTQQNSTSAILTTNNNPIISGCPSNTNLNNINTSSLHKNSSDFAFKKGRISKYAQRPFRREPHNYDKAQPTHHQTTIYQRMLAEQQEAQQIQQQQQQQNLDSLLTAAVASNSNNLFSQQPQLAVNQIPYQDTLPLNNPPSNASNNSAECLNLLNNNNFNVINTNPSSSNFTETNESNQFETELLNSRLKILRSDLLSMYSLNATSDNYGSVGNINDNVYKTPSYLHNSKKAVPNDAYGITTGSSVNQQIYATQTSPISEKNSSAQLLTQQIGNHPSNFAQSLSLTPGQHLSSNLAANQNISLNQLNLSPATPSINLQTLQLQMPQTASTPQSLIYRSNSLPLNVSLQKVDGRDYPTMPKHQINKSCRPRTRSNSINQHMLQIVNSNANPINPSLVKSSTLSNININRHIQPATSDPLLSNAFAQLLTTNSQITLFDQVKQNEATNSIQPEKIAISSPLTNSPINSSIPAVLGSTIMYISSNQITPSPPSASKTLTILPSSNPTAAAAATSEVTIRQAHKHNTEDKHTQQQPPHKSPKKSASLPVRMPSTVTPNLSINKMLSSVQHGVNLPGSSSKLKASMKHQPETYQTNDLPVSPTHSSKYPKDSQRRVGHIHAEQKRRYNIKSGFDQLHDLIPQLQQSNAKLSKAAMLQKCAEHIKHLRNERNVLKERIEALSKERDALNSSLTHLHSILPANGAPVTRQGTEHVRQMFEQYVRVRTTDNWKFWILGLILEPLLSSYTASVSSANLEELRRTAFLWVDQHCSLIDLRPAISNKLRYLSMKTDILSEPPTTLQEEVNKAVNNSNDQHPNLHGT